MRKHSSKLGWLAVWGMAGWLGVLQGGFAITGDGGTGSGGTQVFTNVPYENVTNRNYQLGAASGEFLRQISNMGTNAGDDNLVWSHSGRFIAVDRSDPNRAQSPRGPKFINILGVQDPRNAQDLGPRCDATNFPVLPNITDWTWTDDRVLFGNMPTSGVQKTRLLSCTVTGPVTVAEFLKDPDGQLHVFSPSVIADPLYQRERLLFLTSSSTNDPTMGMDGVMQVWTVTYEHGGTPNWNDKVQLTAFSNNVGIQAVKWALDLHTNFMPRVHRYALVVSSNQAPPGAGTNQPPPAVSYQSPGVVTNQPPPGGTNQPPPGGTNQPPPQMDANNKRIVVFDGVRAFVPGTNQAPPPPGAATNQPPPGGTNLPVSFGDPRFDVRVPEASAGSQVSWTYDGVFLMFSKMGGSNTQGGVFSTKSRGTNYSQTIFDVPPQLASNGVLQWLCISPDGTKVALTSNKRAYILPMTFQNAAMAGQTNVLSDGGYTTVIIPGGALSSNVTFDIMSPDNVVTDNFPGVYIGNARQFTLQGSTNQNEHFNFNTNVEMYIRFEDSDLPDGVAETNLALFLYEPTVTNGQTGVWTQVMSALDTNNNFVVGSVTSFSVYAIGVATAGEAVAGDYDGDGISDLAIFDSNTGFWYIRSMAGDVVSWGTAWGWPGAKAVAGDYNGDNVSDMAVFDGNTGNWYIRTVAGATLAWGTGWGWPGAVPVSGDYDGDAIADLAVFDNNTGGWFIRSIASDVLAWGVSWGWPGAVPVSGDFNGDAQSDLALFDSNTGNWFIRTVDGTILGWMIGWGWPGAVPVAGDYDGDGVADIAVFDSNTGYWYIRTVSGTTLGWGIAWGWPGGVPVPGDFDANGISDLALFDSNTGSWYIRTMGETILAWGIVWGWPGAIPVGSLHSYY
ncbi:MAG: hypothetical protein HY343_07025 [Lentisphaerae bacterium]|nr:hypothetical protein [Lentisphaerota bacterium]